MLLFHEGWTHIQRRVTGIIDRRTNPQKRIPMNSEDLAGIAQGTSDYHDPRTPLEKYQEETGLQNPCDPNDNKNYIRYYHRNWLRSHQFDRTYSLVDFVMQTGNKRIHSLLTHPEQHSLSDLISTIEEESPVT